jgi:hypothetical protein
MLSGPTTSRAATKIEALREPFPLFDRAEKVVNDVSECKLKLKDGNRPMKDASE